MCGEVEGMVSVCLQVVWKPTKGRNDRFFHAMLSGNGRVGEKCGVDAVVGVDACTVCIPVAECLGGDAVQKWGESALGVIMTHFVRGH